MNISEYVLDYLNAFVVMETLAEKDIFFDTPLNNHGHFLYIDGICNLKVSTYGKLCAVYLDCSKNEYKKLKRALDSRQFYYTVRDYKKYKADGYISDVVFEFHLYKEELAKRLLDIIIDFSREERK